MKKNAWFFCGIVLAVFLCTTCGNPWVRDITDPLYEDKDKNRDIYNISIVMYGNASGDSAAARFSMGYHGEQITMDYTVANTDVYNLLAFSGVVAAPAPVVSAGTGTRTYAINAQDAVNRIITA